MKKPIDHLKRFSFFVFFISLSLSGQENHKDFLKGLKKVSSEKINPKQLNYDGVTFPIFGPDGEKIEGTDVYTYLIQDNYVFDPYVDSKNKVKAMVIRKDERIPVSGKAKPFKAVDLKGNIYDLESLKGKVVVINFWFTKCQPCILEIPDLNMLVDKYKDKNVVFLGITFNDKITLEKFLKTNTFKYNIIPNAKKIVDTYGVQLYPTHLIIDQNSNIVLRAQLAPSTITDIEETIDKLIK